MLCRHLPFHLVMWPIDRQKVRPPGFEPGSPAPKAGVLPLHHGRSRWVYLELNQNLTPYERAALPLGHTPKKCRESGSDRRTSCSSGRRFYQLSYLGKRPFPQRAQELLRYTWRDLDPQHRVCRTRALTVELQVHKWLIRNSNPGREIESLLSWSSRRMSLSQCRGLGLNQYALAGAALSKRCVFHSATTA